MKYEEINKLWREAVEKFERTVREESKSLIGMHEKRLKIKACLRELENITKMTPDNFLTGSDEVPSDLKDIWPKDLIQ